MNFSNEIFGNSKDISEQRCSDTRLVNSNGWKIFILKKKKSNKKQTCFPHFFFRERDFHIFRGGTLP